MKSDLNPHDKSESPQARGGSRLGTFQDDGWLALRWRGHLGYRKQTATEMKLRRVKVTSAEMQLD